MQRILAGALLAIALLFGATVGFVFVQARASYRAAVARCLDAGGAWRPATERSFSGTCLRNPDRSPAP